VEAHPLFFERLKPFFEALEKRRLEATISTIIIAEVLVHPLCFNLNLHHFFAHTL